MGLMTRALKAEVRGGRLMLDEPTDLPEGEVVELVPLDDVLAGFGIALAPLTLFRALVDSGEVERVLPRFARRSAPVHVVWPSRRFEPAAVALFRDALVKELARAIAGRPSG